MMARLARLASIRAPAGAARLTRISLRSTSQSQCDPPASASATGGRSRDRVRALGERRRGRNLRHQENVRGASWCRGKALGHRSLGEEPGRIPQEASPAAGETSAWRHGVSGQCGTRLKTGVCRLGSQVFAALAFGRVPPHKRDPRGAALEACQRTLR